MKLGIIGDVHLSVTPPGRRSETYLADVQAKLEQIVSDGADIEAWLLIGDLYHQKRADRIPHWLVAWTWEWLSRLTAPVPDPELPHVRQSARTAFVVPGNHDLPDGSIESLERAPLAVLEHHPEVTVCRGVYDSLGADPWTGQRYHPSAAPLARQQHAMAVPGVGEVCDAKVPADSLFGWPVDWVWAHAPVDFQKRPWPTYDAETLPLHADTRGIIYGHQHDKAGARRRGDGKLVIATGAISRGSITEADHAPAWLVLDTETEDVEVRALAHRPKAEAFRWADKATEVARDETMAAFTAALGAETLVGFSREGLVESIRQRTDLAEHIRTEAVEILELG